MDWNEELGEECLDVPLKVIPRFTEAIQAAQVKLAAGNPRLIPKSRAQARFWSLPLTPWTLFERLPSAKSVHRLISFRGTVTRVGGVRMQELSKQWECTKCGWRGESMADDWIGGVIPKLQVCGGEVDGISCKNTKFSGN